MKEEKESVDGKFQESKFIDEEFRHEDIEDPSQRFVAWDSPPTYDEKPEEDDSWEEEKPPEEYKEDGFYPMFDGLYSKEDDQLDGEEYEEDEFFPIFDGLYPEDDQLEEEEPMDGIADYEKDGEDLSGEVPNFNGEEID
ncbi:uncharacterized protein LOC132191562 [Corylus avellana]|uniref:uncharacterized protein LOC132191562 n=1 Tax=Corylus avellana TaxID=13451 RepID=UPI00286BA8F4|nr:uncharacterized protein LOC132191562 [Corylus avellana]